MALGRFDPHAVPLRDGRVLVVGNDDCWSLDGYNCGRCMRDNSVQTEIWDPSSGTWSALASLTKPRADFAAVPLDDGRVFVTGGVDAGAATHQEYGYQYDAQSYSSSYVLDPGQAGDGWTRAALLETARTDPTAAVLLDGRVVVAGGYYLAGTTGRADPALEAVLVASRSAPTEEAMPPASILADMELPPHVFALATAELYDPVTDSWSTTGSLRYARHGAPAVTLADGRVLVVGSSTDSDGWNATQILVDERVRDTAEIFEPQTGRFSLTGDLPPIEWSPLSAIGLSGFETQPLSTGTLVALADGGALLVGQTTGWDADPFFNSGYIVRTLRLDPTSGRWAEIDRSVERRINESGTSRLIEIVSGESRSGALAAPLLDGRVLVAGGERVMGGESDMTTRTANLYDPATDTWTALSPMPEPRAGGAAVTLADGSVLIVGGHDEWPAGGNECTEGPTGLATAVRFVPEP